MMLFSQIPDKLNYPKLHKRISSMQSDVISYYLDNSSNLTASDKRYIIDILNCISYKVMIGDFIPDYKNAEELIEYITNNISDSVDVSDYLQKLSNMYIDFKSITWDIQNSDTHVCKVERLVSELDISVRESSDNVESSNYSALESSVAIKNNAQFTSSQDTVIESNTIVNVESSCKEDLYIQGPKIPRFDFQQPFLYKVDGPDTLAIYTTLPLVPTKQCQISCTTDINLMSDSDFNKLFPDKLIQTRGEMMYDIDLANKYSLDYDDKLGILIPIQGFTLNQIRDNVLKYPHIFQLKKWVDGKLTNFYSTIEIDGSLHKISDMWSILDDTKSLPKCKDFMKEYVVRRYLLERDILHIEHKYYMLGTLDPFLTLFMPASNYVQYGYSDSISLSMNCVKSRVEYHRSRNPILRRLGYYA